ncbi:unnamed protein product [Clonostachys rosea]|uniref:Uncharacterized protein n=1 Tax=Bionectria ochroleuca TaxID=29856 RepID=A0ABY6V2S0_BIOOC|nr:unnamed protein product [Clonostachys rosea]
MGKPSDSESPTSLPSEAKPPVRILVQTLTHLVPGENNDSKTRDFLNLVCQKHWRCDFEFPKFRWATYGCDFASDNRRCFFLVDHGRSHDDAAVPILPYEWTGKSFEPRIQLLQVPEIQAKLKYGIPFTEPPKPTKKAKSDKRPIRAIVKSRLSYLEEVPTLELDYMRSHLDDLAWLKAHVRPRLWREFVVQLNEEKPTNAPEIEE